MAKAVDAARVPRQKRSEETRRKLISAGRRLFTRHGYHGTSSKKIAKEAGIAVGSFYNHFDDKKELVLEVYRDHVVKIHDMVAARLGALDLSSLGADGRALSHAIIDHTLELHDLSPDFHREIMALSYSDPDFMARRRAEEERVVQMMIAVLTPHRAALRVDDLEAAARVVTMAVEEVIHSVKIFDPPIAEERLTDALGDMLHRYLFKDA